MNLKITEEHAEKLLLLLGEATEGFSAKNDTLWADLVNQIFSGFPSLEEKLINSGRKHMITAAKNYVSTC